jgi:hypothetical protein
VNNKLASPAWGKPYADASLETDSERLLAVLAAKGTAVFQRLWELAADQGRIVPVLRPSCDQVFSSVEKHADRKISSLSKRR